MFSIVFCFTILKSNINPHCVPSLSCTVLEVIRAIKGPMQVNTPASPQRCLGRRGDSEELQGCVISINQSLVWVIMSIGVMPVMYKQVCVW